MNFCKLVSVYAVALGLGLASNAHAATHIESCQYNITQPGVYKVMNDLDCSSLTNPTGITISGTQNVLLKLNHKQLKGKAVPTYLGRGTGIRIQNSSNVQVDGSGATLKNWKYAILISDSSNINIDGDNVEVKNNESGIVAVSAQNLEIDDVKFYQNAQRDTFLRGVRDAKVEDSKFYGKTSTGVLVASSEDIRIRKSKFGRTHQMKHAVDLYQSQSVSLYRLDIGRAEVGVRLQGNLTQDIELDRIEFGNPQNNACDIRVAQGASPAEVSHSGNPTLCP